MCRAHKIYVIGLGKDKPVDSNKTKEGRADNRRVDVRLMTNTVGDTPQPAAAPATTGQNNPSFDVVPNVFLSSSPEDFAKQAAQSLPLSGLYFFGRFQRVCSPR